MKYVVNDEPRECSGELSVRELIEQETGSTDGRGIAIAINADVVPASQWDERLIADGDRADILIAVQGG